MSDPVRSFAYAENPCRLVHETLVELFPKKVTLHLFHSWEGAKCHHVNGGLTESRPNIGMPARRTSRALAWLTVANLIASLCVRKP